MRDEVEVIDEMPDEVERMSVELLDELASNERRVVDPRTLPVRFSTLKHIARSPAHYWHQATTTYDDDSLARRLGSGTHAMMFGTPEVIVFTGKQRRGKAWDAFKAEHAGKVILSRSEHAKASAMVAALHANPLAERLLFSPGTIHEQRLDWSWLGRSIRSTPDARGAYHLVELKTCRTADPEWFKRDATRMAYHAQLAFYRRAILEAIGTKPREVYIVAVESVAPYAVTALQLTERALDQGERLARVWFERLLVCEATNAWPEYSQAIVEFDVADSDFSLTVDGEEVGFD